MGFFDLFKPKPKRTFTTDFGIFTLISPQYGTWKTENNNIFYYVNGDKEQPNKPQVAFLKNILIEVEKLDPKIQQEFEELHRNADFQIDFSSWKERYQIKSFHILVLKDDFVAWEITFFNQKDENDFSDYTLLIENGETKGFSIST